MKKNTALLTVIGTTNQIMISTETVFYLLSVNSKHKGNWG
jgi:hypothetical protein